MLPLSLLNAAKGKPILVELKNGETFNGHLDNCDAFMNLTLTEVYQTSNTGEQFWKLPECYIRGSTVKYCRVADALVDTVKESEEEAKRQRQAQGSLSGGVAMGVRGGRGGGGRGGGRGGSDQSTRGGGGQRGGGQRGGRGRGQH
ncbi:hypothetical protein CBS101457_005663 [Exobasidium rhododendri]|nr:hypothetical protein CBS101457_005663 [Exobasidium rhododendri]